MEMPGEGAARWVAAGMLAMQARRYDEAVRAFRQAIQGAPRLDEPWYQLGAALVAQGNVTEALAALDQCAALRGPFQEQAARAALQLRQQGAPALAPPPLPFPAPMPIPLAMGPPPVPFGAMPPPTGMPMPGMMPPPAGMPMAGMMPPLPLPDGGDEALTASRPAAVPLRGSVGRRAKNHADDVTTVKRRLVDLGFDWVGDGPEIDDGTVSAIRLFQSIHAGQQKLGRDDDDGVIKKDGGCHHWLFASNAPRWQLMPTGSREEAFLNCEREDASDKHDYGTSWLADVIRAAAAHYRDHYLDRVPDASLIVVNDASLPRGGVTKDHETHQTGLCCDLRLPVRGGGTRPGLTWKQPEYDPDAMRAQLVAFHAQPLVSKVFFNDPAMVRERLCAPLHGHDNHVHVVIGAPKRA